jgi:hypothetical protein
LEKNANLEAKSTSGWTVLHFAAESSLLEVVQFLVQEKQLGKLTRPALDRFHDSSKVNAFSFI